MFALEQRRLGLGVPNTAISALFRRDPCSLRCFAVFETEINGCLLQQKILSLGRRQVHSIRVDELYRIFFPHLPGFFGDFLVNSASELILVRNAIHPRQQFSKLFALNHPFAHKRAV